MSKKPSLDSVSEVARQIKGGDAKSIEKIYDQYRDAFLSWALSNYSIPEEDAIDCWQDSVIVFYEQAVQGKLDNISVASKTYLYAIGKNKILELLRKQSNQKKRESGFAENISFGEGQSIGYPDLEELSDERKEQLLRAINALSPKNQELLVKKYYEGMGLEEIKTTGQYKSINAVSASISRALKNLKTVILKRKNLLLLLSFSFLNQ